MGAAVLLGYLFRALLPRIAWLGNTILSVLMLCALWYGHRLEIRWLRSLGRRRIRGTLFLRVTWLVLLWSFLWSYVLLLFARALAWDVQIPGWRNGPLLLTLTLALYHLTMGVKMSLRRWIWLGAVLVLWAVLIPGVPLLRERMFVSIALLVGGALLVSGHWGRREFSRLKSAGSS